MIEPSQKDIDEYVARGKRTNNPTIMRVTNALKRFGPENERLDAKAERLHHMLHDRHPNSSLLDSPYARNAAYQLAIEEYGFAVKWKRIVMRAQDILDAFTPRTKDEALEVYSLKYLANMILTTTHSLESIAIETRKVVS